MTVGDTLDSEDVLLGTVLLVSAFMLVGSFDFERAAAIFPRFTAAATLIGTALLLFGKHTSGRLNELRELSVDVYEDQTGDLEQAVGTDDEARPNTNEEPASQHVTERRTVGRISDELFTVLSTCGYVGLSFLVGMLWASPVFVAVYTTYLGLRYRYRIGLSVAGFLVAYVFMIVTNAPLDEGIVPLVTLR